MAIDHPHRRTRLSALLLVALWSLAESKYIAYNTTQRIVADKLNVHIVAHTHDDVGWLKTVDQYYVGSNNSIQGACVQNVLDSIIPSLLADKNRRFIYVEQAFFQRWWRQQSDEIKNTVKELLSSGQLEFINGGMCMHDEAAVHYIDMIDQTTLGHRFIKQEFGIIPRIGWQIDPFGHSAVQAYLLSAEVGFDALYFFRIDYQDLAKRKDLKSLEVIWRASKSLGLSADIFTGIFPKNYEPPPGGFYFEVNDDSPVIQDDPLLFDYNVQERVDDFVAAALSQANITRANHIMFTMGTDFKYQYANSWFRQLDKFIHYVNKAARQLEFFTERNSSGYTTDSLADALAIAQHHDAVTGTEKQHVANDYAKRLSIGYSEAEKLVGASLACLTEPISRPGCYNMTTKFEQCPLLNISYCPPSEVDLSRGKKLIVLVYNSLGWKRNDIIRIPVISESIVHDSDGNEIESQLLPLADATINLRSHHVKAYLGISPSITPKFWLIFAVSVPPLGFNTYFVSSTKGKGSVASVSTFYSSEESKKSNIEVGKGKLKLLYNVKDGTLTHYLNSRSLVKASMEQTYSYYAGDSGSGSDPQASGAYIFRPNGTFPIKPEKKTPTTIVRGSILDEVHQQINPWIYQVSRVYKDKEHAEVEFTVGPIPVDDEIGKELVTKITTGMATNKTFYTDSNGRDFIKRVRDYRSDWEFQVNQPVAGNYYPVRDYRSDWEFQVNQPVAGNYYPINLGIYMQDDSTEFSVLVDRSVGGSSILDGQIELMLHRRLLYDDGRGVGEALNETVCVDGECAGLTVQGKFYVKIDPLGEGSRWRRTFGQEIYSPLLVAFSKEDGGNWTGSHTANFSAMDPSYSLPDNVALITLQALEDGNVLLRLAHLYEVGEHKDLSAMAYVELKKMFPVRKIGNIIEMNLSANQEKAAVEKKRLKWKTEGSSGVETIARGAPVDPSKLVVELAPMEIRTFMIKFDYITFAKIGDS
ncbi:hypothetical protein C4D60_Mb09t00950 [Musa balbisiana]|uniref:alpha-mannosidase n=1 Tax=Musa balbisiana TaxID=52838 RepID=A0A4S8ID44_MUSBA|nr:hypothetical protein C4D60_Mb09t00950 [Musa balbisiana]